MAAITAKDVKALRDHTGAGMMDCKNALSDAEGDVEKAKDLLRERGLVKAGKRAGRSTSEGAVVIASEGGTAGMVELGCETDFVAKTDDFQALAAELAAIVAADGSINTIEQLSAAKLGDGSVDDRIKAAVAKLGENVQLQRVGRVEAGGVAGGYIHGGGKLGVAVALETTGSGDALTDLVKDISMHVAAVDPTPVSISRDAVPTDIIDKERDMLRREAIQSGKPENVVDKIVDGRINKYYSLHCLLEQAFVKDPDSTVGDVVAKVAGDVGADVVVAQFVRFRLGEASEE